MSDALLPPAAEPLAAARERAIRLLTDRYADDSLSTGEFESRLDRLYATATPIDVETLVADLQVARQVARPLAPVPPMPVADRTQGWAVEHQDQVLPAVRSGGYMQRATRRLLCVLGQRTVAGRWTAPEHLELRAVLSEVVLDLREAVFTNDCELDVMAVLGSVHILLPPDAVLETQMGTVLGEITDRGVAGVAPVSGRTAVLVRLTGTSVLSEVVVRRAPPNLPLGVPHKQAWKASKPSTR